MSAEMLPFAEVISRAFTPSYPYTIFSIPWVSVIGLKIEVRMEALDL